MCLAGGWPPTGHGSWGVGRPALRPRVAPGAQGCPGPLQKQVPLQPRQVPRGEVFRPHRRHVEHLEPVDFLGKAKVREAASHCLGPGLRASGSSRPQGGRPGPVELTLSRALEPSRPWGGSGAQGSRVSSASRRAHGWVLGPGGGATEAAADPQPAWPCLPQPQPRSPWLQPRPAFRPQGAGPWRNRVVWHGHLCPARGPGKQHQQNCWLMGCSSPQGGLVCGERGLPVHKGRLTLVSSCGLGP